MELHQHLMTLTRNNAVEELRTMLPKAQISISLWGQRMVSIEGYEGDVAIDELVNKYLDADPFHMDTWATCRERLECDDLWASVKNLYGQGEEDLAGGCLYKYVVCIQEERLGTFSSSPQSIMFESDEVGTRRRLFYFRPEQFKKIWPDIKSPCVRVDEQKASSWNPFKKAPTTTTLQHMATKQMVEAAAKIAAAKEAAAV